jgi:hypothetical protein
MPRERDVPWSNGDDTSLTKRKRGFDSLRDDSSDRRSGRGSVGVPGASLFCKEGDRVRLSGGPLGSGLKEGPLVQREDAWLATRTSGFDSPAVH